jgi:hypothetical protein
MKKVKNEHNRVYKRRKAHSCSTLSEFGAHRERKKCVPQLLVYEKERKVVKFIEEDSTQVWRSGTTRSDYLTRPKAEGKNVIA